MISQIRKIRITMFTSQVAKNDFNNLWSQVVKKRFELYFVSEYYCFKYCSKMQILSNGKCFENILAKKLSLRVQIPQSWGQIMSNGQCFENILLKIVSIRVQIQNFEVRFCQMVYAFRTLLLKMHPDAPSYICM